MYEISKLRSLIKNIFFQFSNLSEKLQVLLLDKCIFSKINYLLVYRVFQPLKQVFRLG